MTSPADPTGEVVGSHAWLRPSLRRRLAAYLLDLLAVTALVYVATAAIGVLLGPVLRFNADDAGALRVTLDHPVVVLQALAGTVLNATYFVAGWLTRQATLGQRLLGVRVVAAGTWTSLALRQAVLRWVLLGGLFGLAAAVALPWAIPWSVVIGVGLLWAIALFGSTARDRLGRGLHDRIAGDIVVRAVDLRHPTG
ncbi:MAG: RDD family protein [Chloroflexota bacterium]|nr:RDD family protein [Chloroflexota bacterium]